MGAGMAPGAAAGIAAAVLVPLMRRAGDLTVLLTVRAATLADHAGQISFPGGRIEPTDADVTAAALRETWEEVGIAADCVDVLGCLPAVATGSGFLVTPVVAVVQPPASLRLAPDEVAEAFEVPLEFVLDVHNYARETAFLRGRQRTYSVLRYRGRRIWGATAAILRSLTDGDAAAAMPMHDGARAQGGGA
jgi:8-oxo-dGTP pyrophosphatase MutT (NUDIX family)